jgi:hypothetical protein
MNESAYATALEIAKLTLQANPDKFLADPRYPRDSAQNVAAFIEELAKRLTEIEKQLSSTSS